MEDSKPKDAAEENAQQIHRLTAEMTDLIKDIHALQTEMTKIQNEYAALP